MTATTEPDFAAVPSLLYSEMEEDLRRLIRRITDDLSPWSAVVARLDQDNVHDAPLWRAMTQAGIAGLLVPERLGGSGAGAREMAVALEEVGRAIAPVPLLTSSVIATVTLLEVGAPGEPLVTSLASGEAVAGVVLNGAGGGEFSAANSFEAHEADGSHCRITGAVGGVVGCENADWLIVPATERDVLVLVAVKVGDDGATVRAVTSLDMTRPLSFVELSNARGLVLARGARAEQALRSGLLAGMALLASEQLGVAEQALDLACEQLRTRYQFGRLLGSFQSLRHRAADLWTAITGARGGRSLCRCLSGRWHCGCGACRASRAGGLRGRGPRYGGGVPTNDGRHRLHMGEPNTSTAQASGGEP